MTELSDIHKVGVVGCGQMGHGITQVVAEAGFSVVVREADPDALARGLGRIETQLARAVERGRASAEEAEAVRRRIEGTIDFGALADCDLVIEAVSESLALKVEVWQQVDPIAKPGALFATNTSSISVVAQAARTSRPDRFLGLHFFNPVQVMKLLEVVKCVTTSEETLRVGTEFGERVGKMPVQTKDKAGFIVNRLLIPYLLDGIRAFEEGVGSISQIDSAMKAGAGYPMGPFTLSDFIGLDTLASICDVLFDEFRERRFAQPPTLRQMLSAGWYGRKSGIGFYDYSADPPMENPGLG